MKEKPILFSTEMVRAILENRKTQTRRLFPFQAKVSPHKNGYQIEYFDERDNQYYTKHKEDICKYGKIGDRLWIKETYCIDDCKEDPKAPEYLYKADYEDNVDKNLIGVDKWKPSIYMPRKASRITLEIINIRVERLNDISEQDAIAEGIEYFDIEESGKFYKNYNVEYKNWMEFENPIDSYKTLWESINGQGSWEQNPWVWVIEFKRVES